MQLTLVLPLAHHIDCTRAQDELVNKSSHQNGSHGHQGPTALWSEKTRDANCICTLASSQSNYNGQSRLEGKVDGEGCSLQRCELGTRKGSKGDNARDKGLLQLYVRSI